METKLSSKTTVALLFMFLLGPAMVQARDEKSIRQLSEALAQLAPDVDAREAEAVSQTSHQMSRQLARDYRVAWNPSFHNFLINIGARDRGYCAHFSRDIGTKLRDLKLKTLVLHWGAYYPGTPHESNCLVVTARNQAFVDGVVLDAWRRAGRLFWSPVKKDHEFEVERRFGSRFGQHTTRTGVTAWKEDLQESAWLQGRTPITQEKTPAAKNQKRG